MNTPINDFNGLTYMNLIHPLKTISPMQLKEKKFLAESFAFENSSIFRVKIHDFGASLM